MIVRKVEVDFFLPMIGKITETYDLTCANDLACWRANVKKTGTLQLRVRTVGYFENTKENNDILLKAKNDSEIIYETFLKDSL